MQRYWLSFWVDNEVPVEPSPPGILGCWVTGYRSEIVGKDLQSLCVLAEARDEADLWCLIAQVWPGSTLYGRERFCRAVPADWQPPEERFPS